MKTYYELLGLPLDADVEAVKKAFRREIARYHPDKVAHLGPEFEEIAAQRSAELTVAYKTLTDAQARAAYDASLREGSPPARSVAAPPPAAPVDRVEDAPNQAAPASGARRFEHERAGRDAILRRAMTLRTREIVESLYGTVETPRVRGFDLALVPTARPRLLGTPPPRVLIKLVNQADAAAIQQACADAARARVHLGRSPVIAVLLAGQVAPSAALQSAFEAVARQPVSPGSPAEISVLVVDIADMTVRMPPGCSATVRELAESLRA